MVLIYLLYICFYLYSGLSFYLFFGLLFKYARDGTTQANKKMITEERRHYQELIGYQCSDNHWRNTCSILKANKLEVTKENIDFYYSIRKYIPRSAIRISNILTLYSEVSRLTKANKVEVTGAKIKAVVIAKGINPPQPTFSRWFTNIGGYRKDRKYSAEQFKVVMLKALIYKAQYQQSDKLEGAQLHV